jgi:hypothetical protein
MDMYEGVYLSVGDITVIYGKSPAYVYKLASDHGWRRKKLGVRVSYLYEDVDRVLGEQYSEIEVS